MEDDPDRRRSAKERRQERDHGKRAKRSALVRLRCRAAEACRPSAQDVGSRDRACKCLQANGWQLFVVCVQPITL